MVPAVPAAGLDHREDPDHPSGALARVAQPLLVVSSLRSTSVKSDLPGISRNLNNRARSRANGHTWPM
jgi:hypothetical protein